jgi:hypothetical protein
MRSLSPRSCPRLIEAEAMRDGRLGEAERASFERHLAGCPVCWREVEALEALAEAVRAERDGAGADELRVQRERTRLVAAFHRAPAEPQGRGHAPRVLWPAAVVALVAAGFLFFWRGRPIGPPASAVVRGGSGATWSSVHREGGREEITLQRGSLWIRVDHAPRAPSKGSRRLVVLLPDGELEDIGTTFRVSAENGRTTGVAVEEGSVVLRIRGQAPVTIGAGGRWPLPETRPAVPVPPSLPPVPVRPSLPPVAGPAPRERGFRPARAAARPRSIEPAASLPPGPDPSVDFRAALAALAADETRQAAAAFTTFLERHPRDARAEDAAYLRVIALQRAGATAEMKAAAQEYLRRYPAGFRRTEVEALSR